MPWLSLVAVVAVVFVAWSLFRHFGSNRIDALNEKRRPTSRLVGRGVLVDGNRHVEVALAVTHSTLFYENSGMEASIDLQWVREIEYDSELVTGSVPADGRVLRIRTQSQTFEFVIPKDFIARWHLMLPPRRVVTAAAAPVLEPQVAAAT
ncbi:MAG TPA: hypothetical protein VMS98_05805 [Thermoanaerobaculia bacterium]|nr:hypothetical protein [Thermoanaerobaculia bacterium]